MDDPYHGDRGMERLSCMANEAVSLLFSFARSLFSLAMIQTAHGLHSLVHIYIYLINSSELNL